MKGLVRQMKWLRQFGYMNDNWYNYCVWLVRHGLPAFSLLYFTLSKTWGINHTEEVLGTLAAVETFLGTCLGISSTNYKQEVINNDTGV